MNIVDFIILLVLIFAAWRGWKEGLIVQACSLAGLLLGIWLASKLGPHVGAWLHMEGKVASAGGFLVVLLFVVVGVALLGRLLRGITRFAGLGWADTLGGILVAMFKYLLVIGVFFSAIDAVNREDHLFGENSFSRSTFYEPVKKLSEKIFPVFDWAKEQVTKKI